MLSVVRLCGRHLTVYTNAHHSVPVHPVDRLLLGMRWTQVDGALPLGLRSAPKLFTAVADAFLWMMGREGIVHAMHYLDDFLVAGVPETVECRLALEASLSLRNQVGFPVAPHKVEGPSSCLAFLGILIDTVEDTLSLRPGETCTGQDGDSRMAG